MISIHVFELSKNVGWECAFLCTFQLQNIKVFYKRHDLTHDFGSYHSLRDHLPMSDSLLHLRDMFSNNCHVQFPLHLRFLLQGRANCSSLVVGHWPYVYPYCSHLQEQDTSLSGDSSYASSCKESRLRPFVESDIDKNFSLVRGSFIQCRLASDNAPVS